jgi:hypothetical protein
MRLHVAQAAGVSCNRGQSSPLDLPRLLSEAQVAGIPSFCCECLSAQTVGVTRRVDRQDRNQLR